MSKGEKQGKEIEICFFDHDGHYQHVKYVGELSTVSEKVDELNSQAVRDLTVFVDDEVYYDYGEYITDLDFEVVV